MTQETKVAEITVQKVGWPKPPKKRGWIKTSEGEFYQVSSQQCRLFHENEVCQIEYREEGEKDDGTPWLIVSRKLAGASTPAQRVIPQVRAQTNPRDQKQIFVTALLKEVITPTDTLKTLQARGDMLKQLYEYLWGNIKQEETKATIDDEIPETIPDENFPENWREEMK